MLFKNLSLYEIQPGWAPSRQQMEASLARAAFAPCGPTQALAIGFVPPRGLAHAPLVEVIAGQLLLQVQAERRLLPGAVLRREVLAQAQRIEHETGRKPGKRLLRELKDQATLDLLPKAFTKIAQQRIWIDPAAQRLAIDTATPARADELVSLLVQSLPGLALRAVNTEQTPAAAMAGWLLEGEAPAGFTIDRECELRADDENRAAVRYARHALDTDEVRGHIRQGKRPTRLAMTWDGQLSFVLTDTGALRKLAFTDQVNDAMQKPADAAEALDADVALATGTLRQLLPALLDALGGLLQGDRADAAPVAGEAGRPLATPAGAAAPADDGPPF